MPKQCMPFDEQMHLEESAGISGQQFTRLMGEVSVTIEDREEAAWRGLKQFPAEARGKEGREHVPQDGSVLGGRRYGA